MKVSSVITLLVLIIHSGVALADLQSDQDRAILIASKADMTLTKVEKISTHRCEMIEKYLGFADSTMGRAIKHSCDMPEIGISLYAGNDLGEHSPEKVAQYFKGELAKHSMKAEVFIKSDHEYGTSMGFYINGGSWLRTPVDPLKGAELIEAMAAEAILILYTEGRISEWPKGAIQAKKPLAE